jgi:hypothetical protein
MDISSILNIGKSGTRQTLTLMTHQTSARGAEQKQNFLIYMKLPQRILKNAFLI